MTYELTKLAGDIDRLRVGDAVFYRIADIDDLTWPLDAMFDIDAAELPHLVAAAPPETADLAARTIKLSFNSYLIQVDGLNVLVDCGIGNDKARPTRPAWHQRQGNFLQRLAQIGVAPEAVDLVVNTHLHADHVGWNTRRVGESWQPTFANARYVVAASEWRHWRGVHEADPRGALHGAYADSVLPLETATVLDAVDLPHALSRSLTLEAAPGHSPGMAVLRCATGADDVVVAADVIHHPLQLGRLSLNSRFCEDPDLAAETRQAFIARCMAEGTIIAPYHFMTPAYGRVRAGRNVSDMLSFDMLKSSDTA